jgi:hypothetical protein
MEPAYTTIQPGNLYDAGGGFMLDYNRNVSSNLVRRMGPGGPARPMQGFGGFGAVDVRPYVTFYTSAGAVPIAIDPTSVLSGNAVFPIIGNIPYDIDIVSWQFILHVPGYGDVPIPLYGGSGTGGGTVNIPGIGDVPYEVSIGPPAGALAPGSVFSMSNLFSFAGSSVLPLVLIGAAAYFLLRK